jgi:hypothetical protein
MTRAIDARRNEVDTMGELFSRRLMEHNRHPALFLRLLAPYPEHCARYALPHDASAAAADPAAFLRALGRLLNAPPREQPTALREQLSAIASVGADAEGYARLVRVLHERAPEREIPARLSPLDLALWASEADPEALSRAHLRTKGERLRAFWEFLPTRYVEVTAARMEAATERLAQEASAHYRAKGQTGVADIEVEARRRGVRIHAVHGRPARAQGVIDEDERCSVSHFLPYGSDVGWIDHSTGRLSLHAPGDEVHYLRGLLGRVLFNDPGHYARTAIYSAQPLLDRGAAALSCDGIAGLLGVRLTRLEFRRGDDASSSDRWKAKSLAQRCDNPHELATLRASPGVLSMHFEMHLSGVRGPRVVAVHLPNRFEFDPRVDDAPVREFLQARGFADYGSEWSLAA